MKSHLVPDVMSAKNSSRPKPVAAKPAPSAGLTLYVSPDQPASRWLELVLAEKDVDGARLLPVAANAPNEDLMVLNPAQSLPTLADREMVIIGPREIAEYLDERYPHPRFMPFDPAGRARVRMTLAYFERELFPLAAQLPRPAMPGQAAGGATGAEADAARAQVSQILAQNARLFGGARGGFMGIEFSLADCAWLVLLERAALAGLPFDAAIHRYVQRALAREPVASLLPGLTRATLA